MGQYSFRKGLIFIIIMKNMIYNMNIFFRWLTCLLMLHGHFMIMGGGEDEFSRSIKMTYLSKNTCKTSVNAIDSLSHHTQKEGNLSPLKDVTKRVYISTYGAFPGDGQNTLFAVRKAIAENRDNNGLILIFPKGRYDFYPDTVNEAGTGISLMGLKNLTIDGRGSSFIFHSKMSAILIDRCENISLQNFNIDWDRPYISQGQITYTNEKFIDIKINKREYPYQIKGGRIFFEGEGWQLGVSLHNLYDNKTKDIIYRTYDNPLGNNFFDSRAEAIEKDIVRFHTATSYKPPVGTYISMLHARYLASCIQILRSGHISLKNIDIFHSLSMGVVGFRSRNLYLDDVNIRVNDRKGRVFSAIADAFHFSTCRGQIEIKNCTHSGQADDFVNVHGEYIAVKERVNDYAVLLPYKGRTRNSRDIIEPGDEIWFVDSITFQRSKTYKVKQIQTVSQHENFQGYQLIVDHELPKHLNGQFYVENKTWNPSLEIRNCFILKKNRARGILVTTPQKVLIENNYFNTAGAAILIEGDLNYWFESGGVKEINIQNNVFENCVTSGGRWGSSIITITPSIKPSGPLTRPYHSGIKISNNLFKHFDQSILAARSVDGLIFSNNEIVKSNTYIPYSDFPGFFLDGCRNTKIEGNAISKNFYPMKIDLKNMSKTDLILHDKSMTIRK